MPKKETYPGLRKKENTKEKKRDRAYNTIVLTDKTKFKNTFYRLKIKDNNKKQNKNPKVNLSY
jgi:hypothetical protein